MQRQKVSDGAPFQVMLQPVSYGVVNFIVWHRSKSLIGSGGSLSIHTQTGPEAMEGHIHTFSLTRSLSL